MTKIDYGEIYRKSFIKTKILKIRWLNIGMPCIGAMCLLSIGSYWFSILSIYIWILLFINIFFSVSVLGTYMLRNDISSLKLSLFIKKKYSIEFLINKYNISCKKTYIFQNLYEILNDSFNQDDYEYHIKHQFKPSWNIFSNRIKNINSGEINEILYINFKNAKDLVTFKLMI